MLNNTVSYQRTKFFDHCKGVRQGCLLSSMLFNLYVNEIPFLLDQGDTELHRSHSSIKQIPSNRNHLIEINKVCKSNLKDKVRRSFFVTRRYPDFSKIPPDITNNLFNSLFLPLLLYHASMVQRYGESMTKMISPTGKKIDIIEKTHIFRCKQSLGVNKQCPNVAARNKLRRLFLKLTIDINILKFWIHLQNLPDGNIAKRCLQLSKDMAEKNQPGILQKIKTLCDEYSSRSMISNENNGKTFISSIVQNLSEA